MLKHTLNGSTVGNIAFAPPDEGGSGVGNGWDAAGADGSSKDGEAAQQSQKNQTDKDTQDTEDPGDAAIAALTAALGKNLNQDEKPKTAEDIKSTRETLQREMVSAISSFAVPEDLIPEGFDPTDPQAMGKVLNNFGQQVIMSALPILMKPIQTALQTLDVDVNRRIKESINGYSGQTNMEKQLADVTGWDHPSVGPLLKQAMGVLKAEGKPEKEIISSIKAMAGRFNVADTKKKTPDAEEKYILDSLFGG